MPSKIAWRVRTVPNLTLRTWNVQISLQKKVPTWFDSYSCHSHGFEPQRFSRGSSRIAVFSPKPTNHAVNTGTTSKKRARSAGSKLLGSEPQCRNECSEDDFHCLHCIIERSPLMATPARKEVRKLDIIADTGRLLQGEQNEALTATLVYNVS